MAKSMADQVAAADAQRAQDNWGRYAELLTENSTEPAKVKELHELMDALGRTPENVHRDEQIIRGVASLCARIKAAKGTGTREREAQEAIPQFKEETEALIRARAVGLETLEQAVLKAHQEHEEAGAAVHALNKLMAENPELLRHIKPPCFSDIL